MECDKLQLALGVEEVAGSTTPKPLLPTNKVTGRMHGKPVD